MKLPRGLLLFTMSVLAASPAWALSISLPTPTIRFPNGYDGRRADVIHAVLRQPDFKYIDGLTSLWPPKWGTTLVYGGDTRALEKCLRALRQIDGIGVRVTFSPDLAKESGTGHSAGSWWVMFDHTAPDVLTVRINLSAEKIVVRELTLPISEAPARE